MSDWRCGRVTAAGALRGSGRCKVAAAASAGRISRDLIWPFAARVSLYRALDGKLHGMTRFFGAAALTNAALVELCSIPALVRWTSHSAIELLAGIGSHLELVNVELSKRISRGDATEYNFDSSLVTLEQMEVEHLLRRHACSHRRFHNRAIGQVNRLIYCAEKLSWPLKCCPGIRIYGHVLKQMRIRLGRPMDFGILDDRIHTGHTLTSLLATCHADRTPVDEPCRRLLAVPGTLRAANA